MNKNSENTYEIYAVANYNFLIYTDIFSNDKKVDIEVGEERVGLNETRNRVKKTINHCLLD
jgi:hypothetical protein